MLIITRRYNEGLSFTLPDGRIVKLKFRREKGRLQVAIDAPADVAIEREELANKALRANPGEAA